MKILIAADGSEYTKRMLAYLAAHEELLGPKHEYTVAHAVEALPYRAAMHIEPGILRAYYADNADKVFRPIRAFFEQQGIDARFVHAVGEPGQTLAETAERGGFDMIVMGSRGHGEIANLVLGSVTTKVLARSPVPVLIVR